MRGWLGVGGVASEGEGEEAVFGGVFGVDGEGDGAGLHFVRNGGKIADKPIARNGECTDVCGEI